MIAGIGPSVNNGMMVMMTGTQRGIRWKRGCGERMRKEGGPVNESELFVLDRQSRYWQVELDPERTDGRRCLCVVQRQGGFAFCVLV